MLGLDYNETLANEMMDIPFSFYQINSQHPGYHMPLHWHHSFEMIHVMNGKLTVYLDENVVSATDGDIVIVNREIIHGYSPKHCTYQVIDFDVEKLLSTTHLCKDSLYIFTNNHLNILPEVPEKDSSIYQVIRHLFQVASTESEGRELFILGTLYELFATILTNHSYTMNSSLPSNKTTEMFKPLLKFIEESYMNSIILSEMASVCGLSVSHFSKLFHDYFQQTPIDYLNSYRVERACLLLTNSKLSLTEIGYRCGFNDSDYFAKVFKKYKKLTPKQYRNTIAK